MIRVTLTDPERTAVQALRRDPTLRPAERDRVEMGLLSAAGWPVSAIAQHLGCCAATVRTVLKQFTPTDLTTLRRKRPGPPKDWARAAQVTAALNRRLDEPRTWTARPLAHALQEEGI
jgi:transposase